MVKRNERGRLGGSRNVRRSRRDETLSPDRLPLRLEQAQVSAKPEHSLPHVLWRLAYKVAAAGAAPFDLRRVGRRARALPPLTEPYLWATHTALQDDHSIRQTGSTVGRNSTRKPAVA